MKHIQTRTFLRFFIPSAIGALLFVTPIYHNGNFTIPIAVLANLMLDFMGDYATTIICGLITLSMGLTVLHFFYTPRFSRNNPALLNLFKIRGIWLIVRILGFFFAMMLYFNVGPQMIIGDNTGGTVLFGLIPILVCVFCLAGLLLPLLLEFGLLDFVGSLFIRLMRPVFGLPGRSSLDCIASWLGDGSIGVLLTSKQYEEGYYSRREATVIATTFSAVSITFSLVVISEVGLEHLFVPFYLTVALAGIVAAIIVPKLPPLCNIPDEYCVEKKNVEDIPDGLTTAQFGLKLAMERAQNAPTLRRFLRDGLTNVAEMWLGTIPVILSLGTLALIVAEYTPIFHWLGLPFIPLYELLGIPEAAAASSTVIVGFADMFLPSVIISSVESEMTRFVVAAVSVTQLIYMSEIGSIIMGSKIPVSLPKLFIIFLQRTIVTLPVVAAVAHLIF